VFYGDKNNLVGHVRALVFQLFGFTTEGPRRRRREVEAEGTSRDDILGQHTQTVSAACSPQHSYKRARD